jgi:iron(III) transport system permease protein
MYLWVPGLVVAAAMALPLAYLIIRAINGGGETWELLFRARSMAILFRSLLLVVTVTSVCVAIGVPLAWLTARTDLPFRRILAIATALPLAIPSYVAGFLFVVSLGPRGMLQGLLEPLGVDRLPEIYGLPGATLTLGLLSYPYVMMPVRAALTRMDPALEEASRGLGRGTSATFFKVTLPLMRPSILTGALLVALYTLSDFGAVSLLRYESFTWAIFTQYDSSFGRNLAAGLSLVLVAVTFVILFLESLTRSQSKYYRITPGTTRPVAPVLLGRWRWPAFAFSTSVISVALLLPMAILAYWLGRGIAEGETFSMAWDAMRNTLYVSALAAVATGVVSVPIAVLAVRYPRRLTALLERSTYVGFALPGVAVALGIVFFSTNYAGPLYQTVVLLVFAYVVLYLPAAVGISRSGLLQVSPRIEEAARSLGKSQWRAFMSVTLPLMRRGTIAGSALVFLLTMKELPATLILSPIGFKTLSTSIWSSASEAFFAQAAASSLILILAASVPMAFLVLWQRR